VGRAAFCASHTSGLFFYFFVVLTHLCPQERQTLKTLKPADGQSFLNETTIRQNEKTKKSGPSLRVISFVF
jgi:hypothetical protein